MTASDRPDAPRADAVTAVSDCTITAGCGFGLHDPAAHPCGQPIREGDPCRYCGDPILRGPDGLIPCPRCWQPITVADFRGLMAGAGLDTTVRPTP